MEGPAGGLYVAQGVAVKKVDVKARKFNKKREPRESDPNTPHPNQVRRLNHKTINDADRCAFHANVMHELEKWRENGARIPRPRPNLVCCDQAAKYAGAMLKGEMARADATLAADFQSLLLGECIYLKEFSCRADDYDQLTRLTHDIEAHTEGGMVNWSKHLKHDNPEGFETFNAIADRLSNYFDVDVYASRMNFYRDGSDWKPFHHDSHAYGGKSLREDFTIGASFGATRELAFLHEPSGGQFSFPQGNGDIFAFSSEVNDKFQHGVPKAKVRNCGPRFSIILWGRRRTLNERNSSNKGEVIRRVVAPEEAAPAPSDQASRERAPALATEEECAASGGEVASLVEEFKAKATVEPKKEKRERRKGGRLQSGWAKSTQ